MFTFNQLHGKEQFNVYSVFSSPGLYPCELLPSLFVRHPSVNISHFNLLLKNHWANYNQTLVKWSLDCPLPNLCPVIPNSSQDGRQAKNRKKGDEILIVHCCFSISQNELKFKLQLHGKEQFNICSGFSVNYFFQPIYTDYANQAYFDKRSHLNLLL